MNYLAKPQRYESMRYNRCGKSGIKLPSISLGLWHNFGGVDVYETGRAILRRAFDLGITHFDLANNYGPPPGSAEEMFGKALKQDFAPFRDEMIISTKAGYAMWDGPYGDWSSKKYLVASLDASLRRMGLDYVDIYYSHRFDPETPLEETMEALDLILRQGKALYVGISNYRPDQTEQALKILDQLGSRCLIHQAKYSMYERWVENGLLDILGREGIGFIAFSPLAQGLLTNRYLDGIPQDSRVAKPHGFLQKADITENKIKQIRALNDIAQQRGQSLAQMALAWLLKDNRVTSVLVGASSVAQLEDNLHSLDCLEFTRQELTTIEKTLAG